MKSNEKIIAEAVRIEYFEHDGRLFIVFEITDAQSKQDIKRNWIQDIEYKIVDRNLVLNDE